LQIIPNVATPMGQCLPSRPWERRFPARSDDLVDRLHGLF
jgi:hypothetical protein